MAKVKVRQSRNAKSAGTRLRARLAEAEETLNAIRCGEVDAIAVDGPHGRQIFTLQSAEQPYRLLAERMNEGAATLTAEGTILFCNRRLAEMVGCPAERLLGSSLLSILRDGARENFPELMRQVAKKDVRADDHLLRSDGTMLPVQLSLSSIPLEDSGQGICLVATDLSNQKQVEDAAEQSENLNRTLLESLPQMIFAKDRNSRYIRCNENFAKLLGIRSEEFPGKTDYDFFNPALAEKYRTDDQRVMQSGVAEEIVEEYKRDGQTMIVQTVKAPFRNADGTTIGVLGVFFDITARKQEENKLREQAALLDLAHDAILFRGLDSRILLWNRGAKDLYGWSAEEALGKVAHELLQTEFPDSLEAIQTSIQKTREWEGELKYISRDGKAIVVASRWSLLRDEQGNPTAILEINRDITERKRVEEKLRIAALYTHSLIEASLDPLVTISREGKITDVNEATEKVTGVSRERLIGSDFSNYFTDPESARRGYEQVFAQGSVQDYPLAIRSTTGKVTDVLYNATVFKNEAGEVEGVFAAARDVTERKQAEKEVRRLNAELEQRVIQRTAQLEAANKELEAFTYSVSHDLRAPLRHISGFSKILTEEYGSSLAPEGQHHLQRIQEGTQRMGLLVDDLLNLGRIGRHEVRLQISGLNAIVNEVIAELKPECAGRQVEWKVDSLPFVECDPALMKQVLQNLVSNALKFTRPRSPAVIEIGQETQAGTPVVFVRDNGVGFNMKYSDKLFGVFQRLHRPEDFEGTGVGLATVQRIIQKHGGRIWAEAELDKGATFYFTLGTAEKTELNTQAAMAGDKA
jgi:PAS domain S-box-containing protein